MSENAIIAKLREWGCDTDGALDRVLDDEEFYLECLAQFCHDQYFTVLGEQLDQSEVKNAFASAHTLKGVAANLGLTPLFKVLCDVVEPLRAGSLAGTREAYAAVLVQRAHLEELLG